MKHRLHRLVMLVTIGALWADVACAEYEQLKAQVVRIEVTKLVRRRTPAGNYRTALEQFTASGFWVAGTNRVVTCAHVLEGARRVWVCPFWTEANKQPCPCACDKAPSYWSSERGEISLCVIDPKHDIGVIQVPKVGGSFPLTGVGVEQAHITAVGHTEGFPWRVNDGKFTGTTLGTQYAPELLGDVLVCDVSIGPGSSGGIVIDDHNRILGMIQGGSANTKCAIPIANVKEALQKLGRSCTGRLVRSGAAVEVNEQRYANLIHEPTAPEVPKRIWGAFSYEYLVGIDDFDDQVPALRLDLIRSGVSSLSWTLALEWAQREVNRSLVSGSLGITDVAEMSRIAVTVGPRYLTKELGQVALYTGARAGYVHDQINHDYTFDSPLFAPQSYERPASGALGVLSLEAEVFLVTNVRVGGGVEFWQGTGDIGNGVTARVGFRAGVGHGYM